MILQIFSWINFPNTKNCYRLTFIKRRLETLSNCGDKHLREVHFIAVEIPRRYAFLCLWVNCRCKQKNKAPATTRKNC